MFSASWNILLLMAVSVVKGNRGSVEATNWTMWESNPNRSDQPWSPPSLLFNVNGISFPGKKSPGREVKDSAPSNADGKGEQNCTLLFMYAFMAWTETSLPVNFACLSREYNRADWRAVRWVRRELVLISRRSARSVSIFWRGTRSWSGQYCVSLPARYIMALSLAASDSALRVGCTRSHRAVVIVCGHWLAGCSRSCLSTGTPCVYAQYA